MEGIDQARTRKGLLLKEVLHINLTSEGQSCNRDVGVELQDCWVSTLKALRKCLLVTIMRMHVCYLYKECRMFVCIFSMSVVCFFL